MKTFYACLYLLVLMLVSTGIGSVAVSICSCLGWMEFSISKVVVVSQISMLVMIIFTVLWEYMDKNSDL